MIYFDHAATTVLDPLVLEKMMPYLTQKYGNPSSIYAIGQEAKAAVTQARETIASVLECETDEIIFTGSGTEANNLALFGITEAISRSNENTRNHIIVSSIEHHSVLVPAQMLKQQGYEVTYLPVDQYGIIDVGEFVKALTENTMLVSIMYANNEIGTIQNIREIAKICQQLDIIFHTDACQAASSLHLRVKDLGCDAMSINGGKIYGPKGIGALYLRNSIDLQPQMFGGGQENKRRAGTENVAAIVGFAEALKLVQEDREEHNLRIKNLRDLLLKTLHREIPDMHLNGHPENRLPNNINISIEGVEGESLLLRLDMAGIAASTGSACTTGSTEPSHVLKAIGLGSDLTYGSLRITLGKDNTLQEIETASEVIPKIVRELKFVSAVFQ